MAQPSAMAKAATAMVTVAMVSHQVVMAATLMAMAMATIKNKSFPIVKSIKYQDRKKILFEHFMN